MSRQRIISGRSRVTVLNVLGIAWVAIHGLIMIATPAAAFFPLLATAVPFFIGTRKMLRGSHLGPSVTLAGALLMIGADVFMVYIYPAYPNSYPFATMMQFIGHLTGSNVQVVPAASPAPLR